jgi:hypothetical protein
MNEQIKERQEETQKPEDGIKELVLARISVMPPNLKLSIGSYGAFNKEELIERVKKGDEVGMQIIKIHMNFINALTSGKLIESINKAK